MFNLFNNNINETQYQQDKKAVQENSKNDCTSQTTIPTYDTRDFDTLQKARMDLVGEIQAIIEYDNHLHNTNNKLTKSTWENIKSEELVHIGELLALLDYLDETQYQYVQKGIMEFKERLQNN